MIIRNLTERTLTVTAEDRANIKAAVARALAAPVPPDLCQRLRVADLAYVALADQKEARRLRPPSEGVTIPNGFTARFSFELQPPGLVRHLSVSVDRAGALPHPMAVWALAQEFGFRSPERARVWIEEYEPGREAVNVIELVEASASVAGHA